MNNINTLRFSVLFIFLCAIQYITAQDVTIDEARHVAQNLMYEKAGLPQESFLVNEEIVSKNEDQTCYYTFNLKDNGGFVIVSADKRAYPVLGYSLYGNSGKGNHSPAFNEWMQMYISQIQTAQNSKLKQDAATAKEWEKYLTEFAEFSLVKTTKTIAGPLFGPDGNASSISYGQGGYYNDSCPGNSVVGCVATAMSQVMVYFDHPNFGVGYRTYEHTLAGGYQNDFGTLSSSFGSTNYNVALLPPNISSANAAVAQLCHHAGISVLMDYDPSGSSSSTADAASALVTNWDFDKNLEYKYKQFHTGADEWEGMLRAAIDSSLAVIYRGTDNTGQGGHAWVCDGYDDSNNSFHMNWGWYGSDNGYYLLTALNPGTYNFINDQAAIFGIKPNTSDTLTVVWEDFDMDENYYYLTPEWDTDGDNDAQTYGEYTNGYNGSYAKIGNGGEIDQWLVSPKLGLPASSEINLSLYAYRLNSHNQGIEIYISTTGTNVATDFSLIDSYTLTTSWAQYTADLSAYAGQTVYLGIKGTGDESSGFSYVFIDNLYLWAIPNVLPVTPEVTTQPVTSIKAYSAIGNGNITTVGSPTPTAHGICWNTSGTPTVSDILSDEGAVTDTGAFTSLITGLNPGTTYYVRAYVINSTDTSYGGVESFTTVACDIDATAHVDSMVTCYGENDGGASVTATGGTTPYIYSWSNSATTESVTGLAAGWYYITVSDTNDCFSIDSVEITEPDQIITTDSIAICKGEYFARPSGDTLFNITSSTVDISVLPANNGCDSTISTKIHVKSVNVHVDVNGSTITASNGSADSYQWVDCDDDYSPITGETDDTFTATDNGSYAVIIEDNDCIDTSSCESIVIESIEDKDNLFAGSIWPNPTTGKINIHQNKDITPLEVYIYDIDGKVILWKEFTIERSVCTIELPEESGIYLLKLISNSKTATYKVIKK
ncbi:MAG: C10 family peptidase [Bacteroidales bacterium]|nr:C10 family peptidase [Bacteroidales bacterium]